MKFVVSIGIIICWVLIADIGCNNDCAIGEITYISVVVSITEVLDLYFAYIIYSASALAANGQINTTISPSRIEPETPSSYISVQHFESRSGINIERASEQALFERTDLVVAMPVETSQESIPPPPLGIIIQIEDYTKKQSNYESDANISR